jgi:hypothetical protein
MRREAKAEDGVSESHGGRLLSRRALAPSKVVQAHATPNPDEDVDPYRAFRPDYQLTNLAQRPTDASSSIIQRR